MSPFWIELTRYAIVAIVGVAGTIGAARISARLSKRGQTMDNGQRERDQDQEDREFLRSQVKDLLKRVDQLERERTHVQNEANRVIDVVRVVYFAQEEEITALRSEINAGTVPPLLPRPDRPTFPIPNFNLPGASA